MKKTSSYWGTPVTREPPHQNHLRNRHLTITWNNACSFGSRSNRIRDIPPKHGNATQNGQERDVAWLHQTPKNASYCLHHKWLLLIQEWSVYLLVIICTLVWIKTIKTMTLAAKSGSVLLGQVSHYTWSKNMFWPSVILRKWPNKPDQLLIGQVIVYPRILPTAMFAILIHFEEFYGQMIKDQQQFRFDKELPIAVNQRSHCWLKVSVFFIAHLWWGVSLTVCRRWLDW